MLAIAPAACREERGSPSNGLDRVWTSEHFVYQSAPGDDTVCEGVLSTLERHFDALHGALGFEWPAGEKIVYQKFPDQKALRARGQCSQFHDSCFFRELGVQTTDPFEAHELVHAYLSPLGDGHPVLEEGIAEALSCLGKPKGGPERVEVAEAFASTSWKGADALARRRLYRISAGFVSDFTRRHGPAKFLEAYRRARRGDDATAVDRIHRELTGEALATAWSRASEAADGGCLRAYECAAQGLPNRATTSERCDQGDRAVTIDAPGPNWFGQQSRSLVFGRCDGPLLATPFEPSSDVTWWALPPGKYFGAPRDAREPLAIEVRPLDEALGVFDQCDRLDALAVSFMGRFTLHLGATTLPSVTLAVRLRDLDEPSEPLYGVECSPGLDVAFCLGCDPFSCEPVCGANSVAPVRGHDGDDLVFRVRSSESLAGELGVRRVR